MPPITHPSLNGYNRPIPSIQAYPAPQPQVIYQHRPVHAPVSLAHDFNPRLDAVRQSINDVMTPGQKHAARTVAIIGTLISLGGAAAAGYFGMTALVGVASGIGIPVVAAAAFAGAAAGILGLGATVLLTAWLRAGTRKRLRHHPEFVEKLQTMRLLRGQLLAEPKLGKADKQLLRNINKVLGKVEGPGAMIKAQLKTVGLTAISAPLLVACLAMTAAVAVAGEPFMVVNAGTDFGAGSLGGGGLKACKTDEIALANAQDYLMALDP